MMEKNESCGGRVIGAGKFSSETVKTSLRRCPLSLKKEKQLIRGQWPTHHPPSSLQVAPVLAFPHPSLGTVLGARNTDKEAIIASWARVVRQVSGC